MSPWTVEPIYRLDEDRNLAIAALVIGSVGLLRSFREPGPDPQLLALMQPATPLPTFSGGPGLALMTPAVAAGPASLRQIAQSDLLPARVLFENVAATIIARHTFPGAGAQAVVIPALRQSGAGFDITVPTPTAPDSLVLLSSKRLPPVGAAIGDLLVWNGTDWVLLTASTNGFTLKTNGAGVAPSWVQKCHAPACQYFGTFAGFTGTTYGRAATNDWNAGTRRNLCHGLSTRATAISVSTSAMLPGGATLTVEVGQSVSPAQVPVSLATPFSTSLSGTFQINSNLSNTGSAFTAGSKYSSIILTVSGGAYTGDIYADYCVSGE